MTLLPFVENASIHGVEPLKEGGEIRLRIQRMEKELICVLEDSGAGMTTDKKGNCSLTWKWTNQWVIV